MIHYSVNMKHSEKTFQRLARMQYDLFCQKNRWSRSAISLVCMVFGVLNFQKWWGALLIVYASYLASSTYASADHTAKKLSKGIKDSGMEFPSSRYEFQDNALNIITLPENVSLGDPFPYGNVLRLGEDDEYFYLFRDQVGGYMVPKAELSGKEDDFRAFMEGKTGKHFKARVAPVFKLIRRMDVRCRLKKQ
ncbi:MAG: YcxB family protein [Clostridia bacterium]|nr:YcxB family protein [Clostridia bacterium]